MRIAPVVYALALLCAAGRAQQPGFVNDVMPVLTKAGCNAGSCHGAASGKNGFMLSLFGYDPERDWLTLTHELRGRRLDPSCPDESLMLQKATARVPHQGGKRLPPDSALYATVRDWIARGAPDDRADAPHLLGIAVEPAQAELCGLDRPLQLRIRARYGDGSDRDVTALALWSSTNDGVLAVDGQGAATSRGAGEAYVLARFSGFAVVAQVQVHADAAPFVWPGAPEYGFVDELVDQKLQRAHVVPAPVCSDEVFVRRAFLDLLDVPPTPAETRAFLADPTADKRARLVDTLLERDEFADVQAMSWAEVLLVDGDTMEPKGAALLARLLRAAFRSHRPFDEVVRELLTAAGPTFSVPAANFALASDQPNLLGEHVAQAFLGIRLQCAQCHNHPFENWTMDDYYGFAAFFGQLGRKRGEDPTEWIVFDRQNGDVRHKRDGRVVAPKLLRAETPQIAAGTDRRAVLAQWLTAKDNPWFARHVSNRAFARLFGRGIVDPPDDVRLSNPASHPELLARLAQLLVDSAFDVRPLVRALCNSRAYQSARHPDAPPAALFAGNAVRRLSAEQLLAAIDAVTGVPTRLPGLPAGSAATALPSGRTEVRFLELFGRPARASACTCERSTEPTLGQTLHLENGDTIAQKLADRSGRLQRALAAHAEPEAMLDDLFVAAYSRLPRPDEQERLLAPVRACADDKARTAAWQDVYWAVLNSREFLFQH
jgi:hypothetical protein